LGREYKKFAILDSVSLGSELPILEGLRANWENF